MQDFIPGLKLSEIFFNEAVKPILESDFPDLTYSAALVGSGSEVLGYDTPLSMDHHWGPRVTLYISEGDYTKYAEKIKQVLGNKLIHEICGISTNFGKPDAIGVQHLEKIEKGPINHHVYINTLQHYLGNDYSVFDLRLTDWLTIPEQKLLEVTSGKVFHDGLGELNKIREKFSWYPHDIWLYKLSCQWTKLSQEEAFVGRCGDVGDELGSQIVASRLVREIMKLCFCMERKYTPYSKWFGMGFSKLSIASHLSPILRNILSSKEWKEREDNLSKAYEIVATTHNELKITKPLHTKVSRYQGRPYLVIHAGEFASAISSAIKDEQVKKIKEKIGSVDQFIDSTDVLSNISLTKKLGVLFE